MLSCKRTLPKTSTEAKCPIEVGFSDDDDDGDDDARKRLRFTPRVHVAEGVCVDIAQDEDKLKDECAYECHVELYFEDAIKGADPV